MVFNSYIVNLPP